MSSAPTRLGKQRIGKWQQEHRQFNTSLLTFANPSPPGSPLSRVPGGRPSAPGDLCRGPCCVLTGSAPGMEATYHILAVQPWGWPDTVGILWVLIFLCTTSPGCSLCAISCHCSPQGRLACHCAFCCSVLSLLSHFPITGTFWGFPASVLYTALCDPHHPFSLCPWGHSRSRVTSSGTPGPKQIRRGMWVLWVLSGHLGKCMDLLVR